MHIEEAKALHNQGFLIEFRYPLWDYWVESLDPHWVEGVEYRPVVRVVDGQEFNVIRISHLPTYKQPEYNINPHMH